MRKCLCKLLDLAGLFKPVGCYRVSLNSRVRTFAAFKHVRRKFSMLNRPWQIVSKMLGLLLTGYVVGSALDLRNKVLNLSIAKAASNLLVGRRNQFNFIADVVDIAAPTVVYIEIRDSKKHNFITGKTEALSNGSGFIVESDGLILTNAHVVIDKTLKSSISIVVKLLDGRVFDASVEHIDRASDLATVRINCKGLPTLRLGNSNTLKSGEWVVALGSPLALTNTVTCGIISAYRKSDEIGMLNSNQTFYVQTDAGINDGNSGGPLVNLDGEAIGINSMRLLPGISFAIPIDYVKQFLAETRDRKSSKVSVATSQLRYIGISMLSLSEDIKAALQRIDKYPNISGGVLIWKVFPESPASE